MDIYYLGHSAFRLKGKNAVVVLDPFNQEAVGLKFPKTEADIVTISHNHPDHNNSDKAVGAKMVINEPGEYEIMGVSIIGIPSYHDDTEGKSRGGNIIFVIEIDGIRIAHLGDLGHKLNEKTLEAMGDIDVLMIPVGGFFTISAKVASDIVREIEPPYTIPMHYKTNGLNPEIANKISKVDDFLSEIGYDVEKVDKLTLKKDLINQEEYKVILFEKE
jgi:L-ascorbate metabolism protein UlaG (beta-lactamase superfamily)